jgi:hypothetical protein
MKFGHLRGTRGQVRRGATIDLSPGFQAGVIHTWIPRRLKSLPAEGRIISSVTAVTRCLLNPKPSDESLG